MIQLLDPNYWNSSTARIDMTKLQEWETMLEIQEYMMTPEYRTFYKSNELEGFRDGLLQYWWDFDN